MNEKCIETYIFKAKEMISLNLKKGRKAYEEICNMCIHMFYSKEECLNNSINLSWDKTGKLKHIYRVIFALCLLEIIKYLCAN